MKISELQKKILENYKNSEGDLEVINYLFRY